MSAYARAEQRSRPSMLDHDAPGPSLAPDDLAAIRQDQAQQLRPGFVEVTADTSLLDVVGASLRPVLGLRAGEVLHQGNARPTPATSGYRSVATAGGVHGWVSDAATQVISADRIPEDARAQRGSGAEMPSMSLDALSQKDLILMPVAATLHQEARLESEQVGEVARMEMVLCLENPKGGWMKVRKIHGDRAEGYAQSYRAADGEVGTTTVNAKGEWRAGFVLTGAQTGVAVTSHGGQGGTDYSFAPQGQGSLMVGPVELLYENDAPKVNDSTGQPLHFVRSPAGPGGWVAPNAIKEGVWKSGYTLAPPEPSTSGDPDLATQESAPGEAVDVLYRADNNAAVARNQRDPNSQKNVLCHYVRRGGQPAGWMQVSDLNTPNANNGTELTDAAEQDSGAGVGVVEEIKRLCPNGITVAFVAQYDGKDNQAGTFLSEGASFAAANRAVAIQGGTLVVGSVNLIAKKEDMVAILATIQRALRAGDPAAQETTPAWARVANLAIFAHGSNTYDLSKCNHCHQEVPEDAKVCPSCKKTIQRLASWGGLETDAQGWNDTGNLRQTDLVGFARTLTMFTTSQVDVSLFACSTGKAQGEKDAWARQEEGRGGEGSFADLLADHLSEAGATDAMVMGHTTIGPTVRNPFARLYRGGNDGGVNLFNWVFEPLNAWAGALLKDIQDNVELPNPKTVEEALFKWFRDSVISGPTNDVAKMSTDEEIFRIEMRNKALAWMQSQLPTWGVVKEPMTLKRTDDVYPTYPLGKPAQWVRIPGGATLKKAGDEKARFFDNYQWRVPVTWEGAPTDAIAYLRTDWITSA